MGSYQLSNKVVLVTGGTGGLGSATAQCSSSGAHGWPSSTSTHGLLTWPRSSPAPMPSA
jgi:hypothetical protein